MPSEYDFLLPYSRYSRSLRRTGRGWRMALLAAAFGAGVVSTALIVALPLRPFTPDDRASHKAARSAANTTFGATSGQADPPRPSRALTPDAPVESTAQSTSSSPPKPAAKPAEPHAPTRTARQAERAAPSITGADEPVPQPRPRPLALAKEQPAAPVESATASAPAPAGAAAEKPTATPSTDGAVAPMGNDRPSVSEPAVASRDAVRASASGETAPQSHSDGRARAERRRAKSERTIAARSEPVEKPAPRTGERPPAAQSADGAAVPPVPPDNDRPAAAPAANDRPSLSEAAVANHDSETAAASAETAPQSHGDRRVGAEPRRARSERNDATRQERRELSRQEQRRIARTRDDQEQRQYRSVVRTRDDDYGREFVDSYGGREFVDAYGGREGREFVDAYGVRHVILSRRGERSRVATDTDRDRVSAFESGWRPRRFFIFGPSADDDE